MLAGFLPSTVSKDEGTMIDYNPVITPKTSCHTRGVPLHIPMISIQNLQSFHQVSVWFPCYLVNLKIHFGGDFPYPFTTISVTTKSAENPTSSPFLGLTCGGTNFTSLFCEIITTLGHITPNPPNHQSGLH